MVYDLAGPLAPVLAGTATGSQHGAYAVMAGTCQEVEAFGDRCHVAAWYGVYVIDLAHP